VSLRLASHAPWFAPPAGDQPWENVFGVAEDKAQP